MRRTVFVDKLLEELSEGISRAVRALMEAEVWTPLVAPTIPKYRRHHRPIDFAFTLEASDPGITKRGNCVWDSECERCKDQEMRAIVAEAFGGYQNLKLADIPKPAEGGPPSIVPQSGGAA